MTEDQELDRRVARILDPFIAPKEHHFEMDVLQLMMLRSRQQRAASPPPKRRRGRPKLPPGKHRKLTDAQVNEIVRLYRTATITQKALAKRFHVADMTINNVLRQYISDTERLKITEKLRRKYYDDQKAGKGQAEQRAAQGAESAEEQSKIPDACEAEGARSELRAEHKGFQGKELHCGCDETHTGNQD